MMTKREINFFSETLSSGNFTEFLNLFIPGLYDKGTIVTDVLDPNLRKIDTWAKTIDEQFNKICGQNIEGFIEDFGTKKENNFYLSKNKNGLYLCNGETSSTDPDDTVAFTKMDINTIYELITSLQTSNDKKLDKGTVPASLNSAEKIVAALQGNGGLKFDENLLYLNDEGTKKVGYYYLDRLADGIFECLEQTEETVNNSAKFRDVSNKASADRLDNLIGFNGTTLNRLELRTGALSSTKAGEEQFNFEYPFSNICLAVIVWDSPTQTEVIPIAARTWNKNSFTMTANSKAGQCYYFAIGY